MKIIKSYVNFWFWISKEEDGLEYELATPHIRIERIPLEEINDWHIVIHLIFFGCIIGWQIKKKNKK